MLGGSSNSQRHSTLPRRTTGPQVLLGLGTARRRTSMMPPETKGSAGSMWKYGVLIHVSAYGTAVDGW